jgi:hypothetical protein
VREGLQAALQHRRPRAPTPRKLAGHAAAHRIALSRSAPPQGRARWTLQLLADKLVELDQGPPSSDELVRRTLTKTA